MTYLTNLRKLAEAATHGPWHVNCAGNEESGIVRTIETERGIEVAIATTGYVPDDVEARNAIYISRLSPDRVLALLDVIEAAIAAKLAREAEAKAMLKANIAKENYSSPDKELDAAFDAMATASRAELDFDAALAKLEGEGR